MPISKSIQFYLKEKEYQDFIKRLERVAKQKYPFFLDLSTSQIVKALLFEKLIEEENILPVPLKEKKNNRSS